MSIKTPRKKTGDEFSRGETMANFQATRRTFKFMRRGRD